MSKSKTISYLCKVILLLVGVLHFTSCEEVTDHSDTPNIIFIMADDLGYSDLGCYGQEVINTSAIDQLASEGIKFTNCYAGSPVCAPSRSVLMTGQHTGHTTVRGNFGKTPEGEEGRIPLQSKDITIAETLQGVGYHTGMIGKWGLGEPGTTGEPLRQGFDEFYGYLNQRRAHTYYPDYVWRDTTKVHFSGNTQTTKSDYIQDHLITEALEFIDRNQEQPFFLYLPFTLPHDAYEIPDLGHFADSTHWTSDERIYAAMVERLSKDVGKIVDRVDALELDDQTIIVFCSDNGAARRWDGRFDSSGALRGRKRDMYEGGLRSPMIVRYPKRIDANQTSDYPWYFADVLPTIAQIVGASIPDDIDGMDISLALFDSEIKDREQPMYWEFYEGGYQQAIRWRNWKAVLRSQDELWELYDINTDPSETRNIASERKDIVKEIQDIALAEHRPSVFFDKEEVQ